MQQLVWKNADGTELNLTSGSYGITNWEGFSNAELNIQSQKVPFTDGSVFLDALINERELSVTLAICDDNDLYRRYELKRQLISALNPKMGEGYLIYSNDFISKRIKCVARLPIFPTKNSNDAGTQKASLSWVACEPYWEDLEETEICINPNESKVFDIKTDVETLVKCYFSDGAQDAVLNINRKEVEIPHVEKPCVMSSEIGGKSFNSYDMALDLKSCPFVHCGYLDGFYCFASGYTIFGQTSYPNYVVRTKDFKVYEMMNFDFSNIFIYDMKFDEDRNFGIIVCTNKLYCYINGEWVLRSVPNSSCVSCAVIHNSNTLRVLLVSLNGGIYVNTSYDCSSWTVINNERVYQSVKEGKFTLGYDNYIALASTGSYIYGITDNYNFIQLTTIRSQTQNYDYINGYYYDYYNNRRTADFSTWENISVIVKTNTELPLETINFNNGLYVGVTERGHIVRSFDGVNFQEVKALPESLSNYSGYYIFFDKRTSDFIIVGKNAGIEGYFNGTLMKLIPDFDFIIKNKIGSISVKGSNYYLNDENVARAFPITPVCVTCNDDMFVIMDSTSNIYLSTDGKTWTFKHQVRTDSSNAKKICFVKELNLWGALVDLRNDVFIWTSLDLLSWNMVNVGSGYIDIASCDGLLVAITNSGKFVFYDGITANYYQMAHNESGISKFCIAEKLGKISVLAAGKIYMQDISNMRWTYTGICDWTEISLGFNTTDIFFAEDLGVFFCKNSSTNKIYLSFDLQNWTEYISNTQNARLAYDGDNVYVNTDYTSGIINLINEENIIDKIRGDLSLYLQKHNVIKYINGKYSNLRITFRNKYIGV
jgi:hypothetical protein